MGNGKKSISSTNRRSFLKTGTLFGAGAMTAPIISCARLEEKKSPKEKNTDAGPLKTKLRTLGTGEAAFKVSALGLACMGMNHHRDLSETNAQTVRRANDVYPMAALQSEYSMFYRESKL